MRSIAKAKERIRTNGVPNYVKCITYSEFDNINIH